MFLRRKKAPIVFIHGVLGSMGEGIFKGSGELNFGMAEEVYRPIIETLEALGYVEGENLFICYYNWTGESMNSVKEYLIPMINKAKEKSKSPYVDIISHSMGGLVSRAYAQSRLYNDDINRLIMISTPNLGSANAYYFWSGGEVLSRNKYKNVLYRMITKMFILYAGFKYNENIGREFIRKEVPSVKELLPSNKYGDYLILEDTNEYISINNMNIKNDFLDSLNKNKYILKRRNIKTYMIIGKGTDTIENIKVEKQNKEMKLWEDGKPIENIKTMNGDGTVLCNSAGAIDGIKICIDSNHTDILSNCTKELAKILNIRKRNILSENKEIKNNIIYGIITRNIKNIHIEEGDLDSYEIVCKEINSDVSWFIIKSNQETNINLKVSSLSNDSKLIIYKGNISRGTIEEKDVDVKNIDIKSIEL